MTSHCGKSVWLVVPTTSFHRFIWERELTDYDTQYALEQSSNDTDPEAKLKEDKKATKKSKTKAGKGSKGKDNAPTVEFDDDA